MKAVAVAVAVALAATVACKGKPEPPATIAYLVRSTNLELVDSMLVIGDQRKTFELQNRPRELVTPVLGTVVLGDSRLHETDAGTGPLGS